LHEALEERLGWPVRRMHSLCFSSRYPIVEWARRDPGDFWNMCGAAIIAKLVVAVGDREMVIGGVHLETPREALEALPKLSLLSFRTAAIESQASRGLESEVARQWIAPPDESRPLIVAGDFNLVRESAIYRAWWGDLTNAFGVAGHGLGWTKEVRLFGTRIDHVLVDEHFRVRAARTLAPNGSDHRPLVVDLELLPED
jgi:endonuclease/exonuclease/phosphatase family metal-dependent hydrolase